jgi:glycosyltransferase involved in cell wall biosynthesis
LLETGFGVSPVRIKPLPDCVDTERFCPDKFSPEARAALRFQLGIPPDRPIVTYLGLLAPYQGTDDLIRVAVQTKAAGSDLHFLIMGFPHVDRYIQLAHQAGVAERVSFTDRVRYEDAPYFLSLGAISVSPKVSATEGSGKVLNYMAMAQPVVAYDTPVHREYLADAGVYAPAGDMIALGQRLAWLAAEPDRGRQLGLSLRQRAEEFYSWRRAGWQIGQLYAELVGSRGDRSRDGKYEKEP